VVQRIFDEYLGGIGIFSIAQRLTSEGVPSPAANDPARNRHRTGIAWSKSAVRVILTNPRYTGRQVWNKQRKQESLIDVDDVALGNSTRLTWNTKDDWIFSDLPAHPPLVTQEAFEHVRLRMASRSPSSDRTVTRTRHPYAFRGLLVCDACGRKMQGSWNNERAHYRCRFPSEYAIANKVDHPLAVYVREDALLGPLDGWLSRIFAPVHIEESLAAIEDSQPDHSHRLDGLRREIVECDRKLARHRAALEAGADPALIATWSADVQSQRALAAAQLATISQTTGRSRMTADEIRALVDAFGGLLAVLRRADPADKAEVYRQLGVQLTYRHGDRTVLAEVNPRSSMCTVVVSEGGLEPPRPLKGTSTSS
jgi:site-specific DNA recombinase